MNGGRVNRRTIGLIWLLGLVLILVLWAVGPEAFIYRFRELVWDAWAGLDALLARLVHQAFDVVRAAAIGLFVVFWLLGLLAWRNGIRSGGMLAGLSILFLILVDTDWYDPGVKWLTAALLAGAGALAMTGRLTHPPQGPIRSGTKWGAPFQRDSGRG
jgi:hypothetical protein